MPRFRRQCLDCSELTFNTRCDKHASEHARKLQRRKDTPERLAKKKFLYGGSYKTKRGQVLATATHCHLCQQPFQPGDPIEADHLYPELGHASPLAAAHRRCNASRGNQPFTQ
jgi:hypothetical protein